MINKISFTGRETMLGSVVKKAENTTVNYLSAGKVYSSEERFKAAYRAIPTKHPFIAQDAPIDKKYMKKPLVQKAEDVNVDFFSETAPHRFNVLG